MSRSKAGIDATMTCNENGIAIESDHAYAVRTVGAHVNAAARLNAIALRDFDHFAEVGTEYRAIEAELRRVHAWSRLPTDMRRDILAMPLLIEGARQNCVCIDRELHHAHCQLKRLHDRHRELVAEYRAHNVALVAGESVAA